MDVELLIFLYWSLLVLHSSIFTGHSLYKVFSGRDDFWVPLCLTDQLHAPVKMLMRTNYS
uniref:Uncharacterized protein n=1 Tax=Arundo donax TaxID=35708 RepID=A0A0A9E614_ARUDO